ncbi:lysophospholipid acyltransferase family protein [Pseudoxanthomonas sangjuensis]|uniref:lysophospholipid acyltransferase family protein n=1 Tax=Pseudoxanthomonas sangjuensis TaxID=1503750 RepID=UPI001391EA54|nr:lysophospholipid acyltransferase family protein [Pseudoxanthomonas sangjuensis]KAF1707394.1 1-acyl-sn-glycerol-3-phosphate acyltransferase [Pseudoxanthomonas sangjuensis]
MSSPSVPAASGGVAARAWRYLYRVPLLLLHILVFLPPVLLCMVPLWSGLPWGDERLEHRAVRAWSAGLMRIFGFRLRRIGEPLPGAAMFVANHVSWIDIEMLHGQRMMGFVAKREIRGWPVVGWLAARGETIFHQRGSAESLDGVMQAMADRLREGRAVGVFPEGRTRDGHAVGPFHARIFTAAVEAGVPVQPVALRYGARGEAQHVVAFQHGESFFANFVRLIGEPSRSADICFLAPIAPGELEGRRQIAELSRARIVAAMAEA